MNAAILCPGPSLASAPGQPCDLRIGINRAVLHQRCDWWSMVDDYPYRNYRPSYPLCVFTIKETLRRLGSIDEPTVLHEDLYGFAPTSPALSWSTYSHSAALILAAFLGATEIHVAGCDMAGIADFDGTTDPHNRRDDARWKVERAVIASVDRWLVDRGIEVSRWDSSAQSWRTTRSTSPTPI